jgi:hypothetical protein
MRLTLNNFVTKELWMAVSCLLIYISYHRRLLSLKITSPSSKFSLSVRCTQPTPFTYFYSHTYLPLAPPFLLNLIWSPNCMWWWGTNRTYPHFSSAENFLTEPLYSQRLYPVNHFTNSLETAFLGSDLYEPLQFEVRKLYVHCPLLA